MRADTFFHGTTPLAAVGIAVDGFRTLPRHLRYFGRGALGDGIYVTRSLAQACEFTRDFEQAGRGVIVRVALRPGTRLIWLDGEYDRRQIVSLRREFGAGILRLDFHKALPRNKHLSARELIALLNYLESRHDMWLPDGWIGVGGIRAQLRRAHYDGFGNATNDLGIVVFDPSALRAESLHRPAGDDTLIEAEPNWLLCAAREQLAAAERDQAEMVADGAQQWWPPAEEQEALAELERASRQLASFAQRHG